MCTAALLESCGPGPWMSWALHQSKLGRYHMSLGELIVRMIFNCGNISFFVLFIIFQVIIFYNRCSLDISFLIMPADGGGSSCVERSCKEVRQYGTLHRNPVPF